MKKLRPRMKLWLSSASTEGVFGDGKWRLLRAIDSEGSLRAAADKLGISYRKAWGDLKKAEKNLNTALIERVRGGPKGGKSVLTKQGDDWLRAYNSFRSDIERAVDIAYKKHIRGLVK
jgi:molybdate transport system regulatory protein